MIKSEFRRSYHFNGYFRQGDGWSHFLSTVFDEVIFDEVTFPHSVYYPIP